MAEFLANDLPVLSASVRMPRVGIWHGDVVLDGETAPTGPVTVRSDDGGDWALVGTAVRSGVVDGRLELRLVGGAGRLCHVIPARFYHAAPVRVPLRDLLTEVGESLSATADATVLDRSLPAWTRPEGPASSALADLVRATGASWRILADGTFWIGTEAWPEATVGPHDLMVDDPAEDRVEIAADQVPAGLVPGTTWRGRRVSMVEHQISRRNTRTVVWFERDNAVSDRMKGPLDAYVRQAMREVLYHAMYPCRVLGQHPSGGLDLQPDLPMFPPMVDIPIRGSSPGESMKVPAGTRVLLGFEAGDPSRPFVGGWEHTPGGPTVWSVDATRIKLGANAGLGVARQGDPVGASEAMTLWMSQVQAAVNAAAPGAVSAVVATLGSISGASTKVRAE